MCRPTPSISAGSHEEQIVEFVRRIAGASERTRKPEVDRSPREFGQWLAGQTGISVAYFDERFTTSEAEQFLGMQLN